MLIFTDHGVNRPAIMVIYVVKFDMTTKKLLSGVWKMIISEKISNSMSKIGLYSNFSVYIESFQFKKQ